MNSLSARIGLATAVIALLVVLLCGGVTWVAVRWVLLGQLDQTLVEREKTLYQLFRQAAQAADHGPVRLPREFAEGAPAFFQIVDDQGLELVRSPSLDLAVDLDSPEVVIEGDPIWLQLRRGRMARVLARQIPLEEGLGRGLPAQVVMDRAGLGKRPNGILRVGVAGEAFAKEMSRLGWLLMLLALGGAACAGALVWLSRDWLLAPARRLAYALQKVSIGGLTERIVVETPQELAPITHRLNDLLRELEQAVAREKTTIANIAHELRTPISGLRTELEFALVREPHILDADAVRRCLGMATGMQSLVNNLLQLARLEAGSVTVVPADVDLEEVVEQAWDLVAHRAAAKRIRISLSAALEDPVITTCPDKSRVVITNLMDNAVSHAPEGSAVVVGWSSDPQQVMLRLSNPVDRPVDTSRLFVPFWRAEESRTGGDGDHCGLGLALVARIMKLLGGRVGAEVDEGRFVVEVAFPRHTGESVGTTTSVQVQPVVKIRRRRRPPAMDG